MYDPGTPSPGIIRVSSSARSLIRFAPPSRSSLPAAAAAVDAFVGHDHHGGYLRISCMAPHAETQVG
jgi:hypothetical protein